MTTKDPMGLAIKDFFETQKKEVIQVFSDIAEPDIIPVEYLFRSYEQMPEIEQRALLLATGKILDVGAGAGSHALWLQNKGKDVMALEKSKLSAEVLKIRGVKNVLTDDFFKLDEKIKYDTLLFLMNGVGIAGSLEHLPQFLKKCKNLLSPGGKVLLDSSDLAYMFEEAEELPEHYYGEVYYIMEYQGVKSEPFKWLFADFYSLAKQVELTGGKCKKIMDGKHFDYLAEITW